MSPRKDTGPVSSGSESRRKPWKKKTPVEVVFEQTEKLRNEIAATEKVLKEKRAQLEKFEQACQIFKAG